MKFEIPSRKRIQEIGAELGLALDDGYADEVVKFMAPFAAGYEALEAMPEGLPAVKYPREAGYRPTGAENPHGAWYVKTTIKGSGKGPLKGLKAAIKDTVAIAGVPMMNGASVLEGHVPDFDATVVTRLLDAGADILGKAVCEYFSVSGGSYTSASGIVQSPRNPGHTPGGSSTGSAALVAAGDVDIAIGGDQAGSIRIPASYTGVVGIKPTHGLVPYTGIMGIEASIDHTGPLTADVATNARCLEAIAGEDGFDSRQRVPEGWRCAQSLDQGAKGLRIAVVKEGFGQWNSEADVDAGVRAAAKRFADMGAKVGEVSIPYHLNGPALWGPIALGGMYHVMFRGYGMGQNAVGIYPTSLMERMAAGAKRAQEFPDTMRFGLLLACYEDKAYGGHFFAKAQNARRALRAAYDDALKSHDILLMPTTVMKTSKIPAKGAGFAEVMTHSWEMIGNTCPFDLTGHPSLSIPCGYGEGDRPIGLMLTGRHYDEATLYRAGRAFEQAVDWETLR